MVERRCDAARRIAVLLHAVRDRAHPPRRGGGGRNPLRSGSRSRRGRRPNRGAGWHRRSEAVQALLQGAARRQDNIFAAIVGGVTFVLAACGAFLELQAALNTIWRVTPAPGGHVEGVLSRPRPLLRSRGRHWLPAAGVARRRRRPRCAGRLACAMGPGHANRAWHSQLHPLCCRDVRRSSVCSSSSCPTSSWRWSDVATGAFVTALLFAVGKHLIGLYLGQSGADIELRRGRVGHRHPALGVLLVADRAHRGGVHEALCRACARAGRRVAFRRKDRGDAVPAAGTSTAEPAAA